MLSQTVDYEFIGERNPGFCYFCSVVDKIVTGIGIIQKMFIKCIINIQCFSLSKLFEVYTNEE